MLTAAAAAVFRFAAVSLTVVVALVAASDRFLLTVVVVALAAAYGRFCLTPALAAASGCF